MTLRTWLDLRTALAIALAAALFTFFLMTVFCQLTRVTEYRSHPYFAMQAESFLQGRLDIQTTQTLDLTVYQGKTYAYWPPLTPLLMVPVLIVSGSVEAFPYRGFAMALGSICAGLYVLLALQLVQLRGGSIKRGVSLGLFVAWGSSNLIFSLTAYHWYIGQLSASMMLLAALACLLPRGKEWRRARITAGFFFFAMAILGRTNLLLTFPCFFFLAISDSQFGLPGEGSFLKRLALGFRRNVLDYIIPLLLTGCGLAVFLAYNYARFDDPLFRGIQLSNMRSASRVLSDEHGLLSLRYFAKNVYITLLRLPGSAWFDGYQRGEGFSLFIQSPLLLLAFYRSKTSLYPWLVRAIFAGAAAGATFVLLWVGSGAFQFGARYLYDVVPLLSVAVFLNSEQVRWRTVLVLGVLSVAINLAGSLIFAGHLPKFIFSVPVY